MIDVAVRKSLGSGSSAFELDVSFVLPTDGHIVLFGPSGSGKTLTLNAIAGLLRPDSGHVRLHGHDLFNSAQGLHLAPARRNLGYMFQDYALFPHLSVRQNIAFALHPWPWAGSKSKEKVEYWLDFLELGQAADLLPGDISGGQRQRAALARALATQPRLLLLDEPFSALDSLLRKRLRRDLLMLLEKTRVPALLISHDPADVETFARHLVVLKQGRTRHVLSLAQTPPPCAWDNWLESLLA